MYIFEISTEALADGKFEPTMTLKTEQEGEVAFQKFTITETLENEQLALEKARQHAISEAKKMGLAERDFQITVS